MTHAVQHLWPSHNAWQRSFSVFSEPVSGYFCHSPLNIFLLRLKSWGDKEVRGGMFLSCPEFLGYLLYLKNTLSPQNKMPGDTSLWYLILQSSRCIPLLLYPCISPENRQHQFAKCPSLKSPSTSWSRHSCGSFCLKLFLSWKIFTLQREQSLDVSRVHCSFHDFFFPPCLAGKEIGVSSFFLLLVIYSDTLLWMQVVNNRLCSFLFKFVAPNHCFYSYTTAEPQMAHRIGKILRSSAGVYRLYTKVKSERHTWNKFPTPA